MPQRSIFVASSSEAIPTAENLIAALEAALGPDYTVVFWVNTVFKNLDTALGTLEEAVRAHDYGVFYCYPDDLSDVRGTQAFQTRDNVIFEFGLFLSILGRERTFLIRPNDRGPACRILSDIGNSSFTPQFAFSLSGGDKVIDLPSLEKAANDVAASIRRDVTTREIDRSDKIRSKTRLDQSIHNYKAELNEIELSGGSNTRLLNAAASHIGEFLAFKAASTERSVKDAAEDLASYFDLIDDLLTIEQLSGQQRTSVIKPIAEVWVFADPPLEFEASIDGQARRQIPKLQQTMIDNVNDGVKYCYFVSGGFRESKLTKLLKDRNVAAKKFSNVQVIKLDKMAFKTFFTVHKFKDGHRDVFMSAEMQGRNDLLIKVSAIQAERIYDRLDKLRGSDTTYKGVSVRDFVLDPN